MLALLSLASVTCQLDNRLEKQRLARGWMGLLNQLGEEIERIHRRADTNQNGTHAAQERHNDLAPDANRHKSPFLTDDQISIDATQTFFSRRFKNKTSQSYTLRKKCVRRRRVTLGLLEYHKKKKCLYASALR